MFMRIKYINMTYIYVIANIFSCQIQMIPELKPLICTTHANHTRQNPFSSVFSFFFSLRFSFLTYCAAFMSNKMDFTYFYFNSFSSIFNSYFQLNLVFWGGKLFEHFNSRRDNWIVELQLTQLLPRNRCALKKVLNSLVWFVAFFVFRAKKNYGVQRRTQSVQPYESIYVHVIAYIQSQ